MNEDIHQPHDKGYKYLLSSKRAFMALLRTFVRGRWVDQIEEAHLTRIDKSYILPDFKEKEADLVYRAELSAGAELPGGIIFYVLLEMQSTVDHLMPYRLLLYQVEIWRDVLKDSGPAALGRKTDRLPAIVPIVLYNGRPAWTAAKRFRELLAGAHLFGDELLDFRYHLIDVRRYREEELLALSNVLGAVFMLDQAEGYEEIGRRLEKLLGTLRKLDDAEKQLFAQWMKAIIGGRLGASGRRKIEEIARRMVTEGGIDMQTNIERILDEALHQKYLEGMNEGKAEGKAEGRTEGNLEAKTAIAKNLLRLGMDVATVAKATELGEETVEALRREIERLQ